MIVHSYSQWFTHNILQTCIFVEKSPLPLSRSGETPALYTVLPEKTASVGGAMMGSSHVYDMASAVPGALKKVSDNNEDNLTRLIIIFLLLYRHLVHPTKGSR